MFGLGWVEILIIVLILLLVFGTTRLPQLGESLGKGIKNFQKALKNEKKEKSEDSSEEKDKEAKS